MAFKLQFAGDNQPQEQNVAPATGEYASPDRVGNAEDVINPPDSARTTSREAHVEVASVKGSDVNRRPKRNNSDRETGPSPAKEVGKSNRNQSGSRERFPGSSVEPVRFSVLEIASLPIREFTSAVRDYERGVGVHNCAVRLMLSHGMFENYSVSDPVPEAKMGEHRDKVVRMYFIHQFSNLIESKSVDTMTDLDPNGKYRKPVRPYHVYYDLFDYLREHASALSDYQHTLKVACRAVLSYYDCVGDEYGSISAPVGIKDQKGGKLGDSPKAVAKFQATMKLCNKIAEGGSVDATTLYDLANRMRLFCPGFAPKDWRSSVK